MHTIVNHFPIKPGADWAEIAARIEVFAQTEGRACAALRTIQFLKASDTEAIFVVTFDDLDSLNAFSSDVAGPWFRANIKDYLAGPADRTVAEVVAGFA